MSESTSRTFCTMLCSAELIYNYNICFANDLKFGEDIIFRYECLYLCEKWHVEQKLLYLYRENRKSAVHSRKYGLDYFVPLLNGYLVMDSDMKQWADERRGICTAGRGIADFYIDDMIDEHFLHFGSVQDIVKAEHNYPELFKDRNLEMKVTDRSFLLKRVVLNYLKGAIMKMAEIFKNSHVIRIILEKIKYPIEV